MVRADGLIVELITRRSAVQVRHRPACRAIGAALVGPALISRFLVYVARSVPA